MEVNNLISSISFSELVDTLSKIGGFLGGIAAISALYIGNKAVKDYWRIKRSNAAKDMGCLTQSTKWKEVSKKLPPDRADLLLYKAGEVWIGRMLYENECPVFLIKDYTAIGDPYFYSYQQSEPTHWCHLPVLPKRID